MQVQAIVDHHHADVKTASKVRFAEPGAGEPTSEDAPSPPLTDNEEKDKDDKVNLILVRNATYIGIKRVFNAQSSIPTE